MDAVASENTWSDSVGAYPLATWVAPEVIGGTLPYEYLILNDVRTTSPPRSITLDVTSTVSDWLTGVTATARGRSARKPRNRFGTEITHCRTGPDGMT